MEELHEQMIPPEVSGCAPMPKEGAE
jgi:hypothetical protein